MIGKADCFAINTKVKSWTHRWIDKPQNRNTAVCQHSRTAERIDPVNPAAAMNTRKCSLMQYGRKGDVYAWRCGWRGRGNAEPRVRAKDRGVERARWETHRERAGGVALWIRHYSPRLLLPTYRALSLTQVRMKRVRAVTRTHVAFRSSKKRASTAVCVQQQHFAGSHGKKRIDGGKQKEGKKKEMANAEPVEISWMLDLFLPSSSRINQ